MTFTELSRSRWTPHVALFVIALGVRVAWVVAVDRAGQFPLNDALMYHVNAVSINEGNGFRPIGGGPTARWPPGYSAVLAGVYWLFGIDPLWGELFNALLGAVTVVLLMVLVERVVDRTTAIVAGVMLTLLPGQIIWTDVLVSETIFTLLFVGLFVALSYARPSWRWLIVLGVVIGVGGLVRGEALSWGLLPIVLWWREMPRIDLAKRISAIAGVAILVLLPWTIRNAIVMDAFVPIATNASDTLWAGHNPGATGSQMYVTEAYLQQFDQNPPHRELQASKALRNDAFEYMFTHPLQELKLIPLKLIHLNRGDSFALVWVNETPGIPPLSALNYERIGVLADIGYFGLLALTLLGSVFLGREFWSRPTFRCIKASFATALFLYGFLYYGNYRYRIPYEALMVVVAATIVTQMWRRMRGPIVA